MRLALVLVAALVAALVVASPSVAVQPLSITIDQGMTPAYGDAIPDYVVRCDGNPIVVSVSAPDGTGVSVDHTAMRSGSFTQAVALTAGQEFSIAVRQGAGTAHHWVRCLPADFPSNYTFTPQGPVAPGLFTVDGLDHYTAVFDTDGVPVWWMRTGLSALDSVVLADGTYGFYDLGAHTNRIYSLDGQPLRNVSTVNGGTDLHELQLMSNGDYLVDSYVPRDHVDLSAHGGPSDATVLDGEVEEIAPDGHLVWSWSTANHLTPDDTPQYWYDQVLPKNSPYDIIHLNSIELSGNEIIISMRHTDAVWGIDRATGAVLWKLGGTTNAHSLTVVGDPQGSYPLRGQHDARVLPDGTFTIHDNNTGLSAAPRAVHYAIDEQAGTATYLDSMSDTDLPSSPCCGSARRFPDGGWLTSWGGDYTIGRYAPNGTRLFKLDLGANFDYRSLPVPATTTVDRLRAGMNAQYPRIDDNLAPTAVIGASPDRGLVGDPFSFTGDSSTDPDGAVASYDWDFGDGSAASGPSLTHAYTRPGVYLVRLTVHDDAGAASTATRTVNVVAPDPQLPFALFTFAPGSARTGTRVGFDGSASSVPAGSIVSWAWSFGDGSHASGPVASHAYTRAGRHPVTLTVVSNAGLFAVVTQTLTIVNRPPTVAFLLASHRARVRQSVVFDSDAHDPDGEVVSYSWSFGDGSRASGRLVRHVYRHPGSYRVIVTVRDNSGSTSRRMERVSVV